MEHYTRNVVKKKFMSDPYNLVDDGNGIIDLVQINIEAFHSQEIAIRASIRM